MKKLSIITINKNNKIGLNKTISSVLSQTFYDKIQFIVIDGESSDGSNLLLDPSLFTTISEPDDGIFDAMNKGIRLAEGEYSLFLNSGDYLQSTTVIEEIFKLLENIDVISFPYMYYPCGVLRKPPLRDQLFDIFFWYSLPHHSTFIKTSLLKNRPYDNTFKILGDVDLFFDLLIMKKCSYTTFPDVICYVEDSGISKQKNYECRLERKKMMNKYKNSCDTPIYSRRINNFIEGSNIDKINVVTDGLLPQQDYMNIEVHSKEDLHRIKHGYMIILDNTDVPKDYIRNKYNDYVFKHFYNRSYRDTPDKFESGVLYRL